MVIEKEKKGTAQLMKGSAVAGKILDGIRSEVEKLEMCGARAGVAMVLLSKNPATCQYFYAAKRACVKAGVGAFEYNLSEGSSLNEILNLIKQLNNDERISGILLFLPMPRHLDSRMIINTITPEKDVDGLGSISIGRLAAEESTEQLFSLFPDFSLKTTFLPCTPYGVMKLLEYYGINPLRKKAVVVGKSLTVGKSLALMLLAKGATVTVCHKDTADLRAETLSADVLCVAAGRPNLITMDMVKEGAVVVDIGINTLPDGRIIGDVDFEGVSQKASYITPVPGGVGPVTIAILIKNSVISAKRIAGILD